MNHLPRFKKSASAVILFTMAALGGPVLAQQQMPPGFGGPQEMPEQASPEHIESACTGMRDFMKQPGLAGLLQGLPYNLDYQPGPLAQNLQIACGFTERDWSAMPQISMVKPDDIIKDKIQFCRTMNNLVEQGSIGILGAFGGGARGNLEYGQEMLGYACNISPYELAAINRIRAEEKARAPFEFPENMGPATPEEIAAACKAIENGLNGHPGAGIVLGNAAIAAAVKSSCPGITAETIAAAPTPQSLLDRDKKENPAAAASMTLESAAADACANLKENIAADPGFNEIFRRDPDGFRAACDIKKTAAQAQPEPQSNAAPDEKTGAAVHEICQNIIGVSVNHVGMNILLKGHKGIDYDPAPLADAFRKQCNIPDAAWARIPTYGETVPKFRSANPQILRQAHDSACKLLKGMDMNDIGVAALMGSKPMVEAMAAACPAPG